MSQKEIVLKKIQNQLIVSCQARKGWPMYGKEIMAAFAEAAVLGGAGGIRATDPENIRAIKNRVNVPVIGINKIFEKKYEVYITPTYESAKAILDEGIEIIALDATNRVRPNNENVEDIVNKIRKNYPNVLIMGEVATIDQAISILPLDFDLISNTLSGYTNDSESLTNLQFIEELSKLTTKPIIAEGKIESGEECRICLEKGAYSVVVGTAITRPEIITQRFVTEMKKKKI